MNTLIELHDKAVADAVAAAIANKGDRDTPSRAALVQGIESLQAEVERLKSLNTLAVQQAETLVKQRDTLRAELDKLKGAEPVALALTDEEIDDLRSRYTDKQESREDVRNLVRAAIAKAAPQAPAGETK